MKSIKFTIITILLCLLLLLVIGRYLERFVDCDRHKLSIAWKCLNKSTEDRYRIYTNILEEEPGNFYRRKIALNKMIEIGEIALPLIVRELENGISDFNKKRLLINAMGNIDPNRYADAFTGLPFSEYQIDDNLAKESLGISFLKAANVDHEQEQKILKRIYSFGDEYREKYEEYDNYINGGNSP
ncbi:MAG: hypothetical protein ABFR90_02980 [Planctomycetota bacterium]